MLFWFITIYQVWTACASVLPCFGVPSNDEPRLLVCQGRDIDSFPILNSLEMSVIENIDISNTWIYELPYITKTIYPILKGFTDWENTILQCSSILNLMIYHPNAHFETGCIWQTESSSVITSSMSDSTTQSTTYSPTSTPTESNTDAPTYAPTGSIAESVTDSPTSASSKTLSSPTTLVSIRNTNVPVASPIISSQLQK